MLQKRDDGIRRMATILVAAGRNPLCTDARNTDVVIMRQPLFKQFINNCIFQYTSLSFPSMF